MRRIKVILAAAAAMAVLMVLTAAPALAEEVEVDGTVFWLGDDVVWFVDDGSVSGVDLDDGIEFEGSSINTGGGSNSGSVSNQQGVVTGGSSQSVDID
ncbi:MAG: hypothetical protein M3246_02565 [Actinomycetota bacterium]|nr:hypothetical protein [Actinomycetota bacterium]